MPKYCQPSAMMLFWRSLHLGSKTSVKEHNSFGKDWTTLIVEFYQRLLTAIKAYRNYITSKYMELYWKLKQGLQGNVRYCDSIILILHTFIFCCKACTNGEMSFKDNLNILDLKYKSTTCSSSVSTSTFEMSTKFIFFTEFTWKFSNIKNTGI